MHEGNYLRLQREFLQALQDFFFSQETSDDFSGLLYIFLEVVAHNPEYVLQTWIKREIVTVQILTCKINFHDKGVSIYILENFLGWALQFYIIFCLIILTCFFLLAQSKFQN